MATEIEAYALVHQRVNHMIMVDADLNSAGAGIEERYRTLLNSVKDFRTFLENYAAGRDQ